MLIGILFVVWMLFFDTNSFLIHQELNNDTKSLEDNKEFYQEEIDRDKKFIKRMEDPDEVEKYAREKYYLKREDEDIYIIEHQDSLSTQENE